MAKLRDLITESKFLKREFGEPLPTFKDVMEKHQINKLKEDWWSDMDAAAQAQYIKDHPGSKQAQDAGGDEPDYGDTRNAQHFSDEPEKITKGPGGYGDRGNVRGQDQANFGEPDDEEYFKSMMQRTGDELNQETLTIDGKQFRRISESVEKEEKPKHTFSEFYQRFKR
jgi:hypothetical protein